MNIRDDDFEDDTDDERPPRPVTGSGFVAYPLDEAIEGAHDPKPEPETAPSRRDPFDWNLPPHTDDQDEGLEDRRTSLLAELDSINSQLGYPAAIGTATGATATGTTDTRATTQPASQATATGASQHPATSASPQTPGSPGAWVPGNAPFATATPSASLELASAHARSPVAVAAEEPPETVADSLRGLPQWQQRYVLALMELGGIVALACKRCQCSRQSIEKFQALSPQFRKACEAAVNHTTDLVEAAVFKGATVGDLAPVFQGGIRVGFKRVRNSADAKLILELRGRLKPEGSSEARAGSVQPIAPEAVPSIVAAVTARLFAANKGRPVKTIDAESGKVLDP